MNWLKIDGYTPMPENEFFYTCISDDKGQRNFQHLKKQGNLFFTTDGTYVYYVPTHYLL